MPGKGTQMIRSALSDAEWAYVNATLTAAQRRLALLDWADRLSGKRWRQLTAGLSENNASALNMWPMFVGGDTSDMDTFITDVWGRPVTNDNLRDVFVAFNEWYATIAPNEYHEPKRPEIMQDWAW